MKPDKNVMRVVIIKSMIAFRSTLLIQVLSCCLTNSSTTAIRADADRHVSCFYFMLCHLNFIVVVSEIYIYKNLMLFRSSIRYLYIFLYVMGIRTNL